MKKAIYTLYALMLILFPASADIGEPAETKDVEPKETLSVPYKGLSISFLSYKVEKVEEKKVEEAVTTQQPPVEEIKQEPMGKRQTFEITAYTANVESTGKHKGSKGYGITASGTTVTENRTLSCPKSLSFGTKIHIPSLGKTYTCEDRGSKITEGHLDLYIKELDEALKFGRKKMEVVILPNDSI